MRPQNLEYGKKALVQTSHSALYTNTTYLSYPNIPPLFQGVLLSDLWYSVAMATVLDSMKPCIAVKAIQDGVKKRRMVLQKWP